MQKTQAQVLREWMDTLTQPLQESTDLSFTDRHLKDAYGSSYGWNCLPTALDNLAMFESLGFKKDEELSGADKTGLSWLVYKTTTAAILLLLRDGKPEGISVSTAEEQDKRYGKYYHLFVENGFIKDEHAEEAKRRALRELQRNLKVGDRVSIMVDGLTNEYIDAIITQIIPKTSRTDMKFVIRQQNGETHKVNYYNVIPKGFQG